MYITNDIIMISGDSKIGPEHTYIILWARGSFWTFLNFGNVDPSVDKELAKKREIVKQINDFSFFISIYADNNNHVSI